MRFSFLSVVRIRLFLETSSVGQSNEARGSSNCDCWQCGSKSLPISGSLYDSDCHFMDSRTIRRLRNGSDGRRRLVALYLTKTEHKYLPSNNRLGTKLRMYFCLII